MIFLVKIADAFACKFASFTPFLSIKEYSKINDGWLTP